MHEHDDQTILKINAKNNCIACTMENTPSVVHLCISCKIPVHAIEPCSYPHGEEGYGQERACRTCVESGTAKIVLSTKLVEHWRGLGDKVNPSGMYLRNNKEKISAALGKTGKTCLFSKMETALGSSLLISTKKYFIVEYMRI